MRTVEIRPADGGADAEGFALELTSGISRALTRESIAHSVTDGSIVVTGKRPQWL